MINRRCLQEPPSEVWPAAEQLSEAVAKHNAGDRAGAAACFQRADAPAIGVWFAKVVGPFDVNIHGPRPKTLDPPPLPLAVRKKPRMPNAATKAAIIARDGFHCRFCEMSLIPKETIRLIAKAYPETARWTDVAAEQHKFFQAANLQYDHVMPHARGGASDAGNMVATCAVCNYGRGAFTLEETLLIDPRSFAPRLSSWNGLQSFLNRSGT